jgi:hypothetical protein
MFFEVMLAVLHSTSIFPHIFRVNSIHCTFMSAIQKRKNFLVRIIMYTGLTLCTVSKIILDCSNKALLKCVLLLEIHGLVQFGFLTYCSETDLPEAV